MYICAHGARRLSILVENTVLYTYVWTPAATHTRTHTQTYVLDHRVQSYSHMFLDAVYVCILWPNGVLSGQPSRYTRGSAAPSPRDASEAGATVAQGRNTHTQERLWVLSTFELLVRGAPGVVRHYLGMSARASCNFNGYNSNDYLA